MNRPYSAEMILDHSREIQRTFPFPNYITEAQVRGMAHVAKKILAFSPGPALLDIGSGPMDKTALFQRLDFDCYAADDLADPWHQAPENLNKILRFAEHLGIRFHHQKDGAVEIPFPLDFFDVVTAFDVIEHLHESPRNLLNTAARHLKTDGVFCLTMPNSVNLRKRLSVCFGATNYPPIDQFYHNIGRWRGHVREYTLAEAVYICEAAGFEVLSATTFEGLAYDKFRPPVLQAFLLASSAIPSLRSCLCVVARKPKSWTPVAEDPDAFRKAVASSLPPGIR
ncbi:MAG: methyltransferase domain-containing protein [Elusimicrobia bacterium]|nr:methyltransferase domain-containing protein [Elusimicrobiota bacterium]